MFAKLSEKYIMGAATDHMAFSRKRANELCRHTAGPRKEGEVVLKALTFDFWNTLVREKGSESIGRVAVARLSDILARHGQARPAQAIAAAAGECRDLVMAGQVQEGREMPPEEQVPWILRRLEVEATPALTAEVYQAYITAALEEMPEAVPGVEAVLPELTRYVRLAVICNTGRTPGSTARIILERLGLARFFSYLTFSNELGVAKPHPAIFQHTLAALGLEPGEVAHVGDDPRTDVKGAKGVGMRAVWFNPSGRSNDVSCDLELRRFADLLAWIAEQAST